MYVRRVVIGDLKGFRELDFAFEREDGCYAGWSVITGENASGKTALLKAIALALVGPDTARILQPNLKGWIRSGCSRASIEVEVVPKEQDRFVKGGRRVESSFWCELELHTTAKGEINLAAARERRRRKKGPLNGPWSEDAIGWFVVGYGPFRRLYGASPDAQRVMSGPSRVARFATMFREDATLGECEKWLTYLSHKKLESKPREELILAQVLEILNHEFLRHGLRVEKVDSDGLWLRDTSDTLLPLADMSEGYRAALAMLIDIIRHCIAVYGEEGLLSREDGRVSIGHPGVVLIDEVDSHLHPEWQRQIGFWLKSHFPNIQFIVTTHSALICQAADMNGLFHLPAPTRGDAAPFRLEEEDRLRIMRSKSDEILLSPAFELKHTRSPVAVRARQEFAELQAKKAATGNLSAADVNKQRQLALFVEAE